MLLTSKVSVDDVYDLDYMQGAGLHAGTLHEDVINAVVETVVNHNNDLVVKYGGRRHKSWLAG